MGYEHSNTTPKTKSDEIIKSGVEKFVPILSENEITLEDKRECDMPVCETSPICDDHFDILSDSNNNDDISSDEDAFEDIEYVEASLPDPEIVSLEEENVVYHEEEEFDLEEIQDIILCEKLLSINQTRSSNTTTHVDDSLPEYDSFCFEIKPDQESIISDDSIPFPNNESSDSDFDNPSFLRPPSKPPDADFEPDSREEILVVMNDELECLDLRDEFDNDDYSSFMFLIYSKAAFDLTEFLTLAFPLAFETKRLLKGRGSPGRNKTPGPRSARVPMWQFFKGLGGKDYAQNHAQPEDSNELFQKLLEDLKELAEYINSPSRDHPSFFDNNEDHSVQNKEYSSNEIASSNSNQEKEGPS
nr:hypothetical protein [Tanacetum cinerariifolium]